MESIRKYEEDKELLEDVMVETMDAFASVISNNLNIVMKMAIPTMISSSHRCKAAEDHAEAAPCAYEPVPQLCPYPYVCTHPALECAIPPALGQPCSANTGCAAPASCIDGECRTLDPAQCRPPGFPP